MFELIAFDADDTLWENEAYYRAGRRAFDAVLAGYGVSSKAADAVHQVEIDNLDVYGYGAAGFVISLVEAAIQLTDGRLRADDVGRLLDIGKQIIGAEVEIFEGVEKTITQLANSYPLMVVTKGDLLHQQSKLDRSGLAPHFSYVEIVSQKDQATYAALLSKHGVDPSRFLMVGNSMKSDIVPVLELGGYAIHLHRALTWDHETVEGISVPQGRYREADHISQVPALVQSLEGSADGP